MKKIILIAMVSSGIAVQAQTKTWLDVPYVEVTGKAEMEIVPNEIFIDITINEQNNAKKSVEQLERDMKQALQKLGVNAEKDLRVKDMSSALQQFWYKSDKIYTSKVYQLLMHSAADLGKAVQALEAAGISNIRIERVSHSDIQKLRREVKINAAKDARQKAEDMAVAVGQSLGGCLHLQEIEHYAAPRPLRVAAKTAAFSIAQDDAAMEPELEFEKIKLEYSVAAKFGIK